MKKSELIESPFYKTIIDVAERMDSMGRVEVLMQHENYMLILDNAILLLNFKGYLPELIFASKPDTFTDEVTVFLQEVDLQLRSINENLGVILHIKGGTILLYSILSGVENYKLELKSWKKIFRKNVEEHEGSVKSLEKNLMISYARQDEDVSKLEALMTKKQGWHVLLRNEVIDFPKVREGGLTLLNVRKDLYYDKTKFQWVFNEKTLMTVIFAGLLRQKIINKKIVNSKEYTENFDEEKSVWKFKFASIFISVELELRYNIHDGEWCAFSPDDGVSLVIKEVRDFETFFKRCETIMMEKNQIDVLIHANADNYLTKIKDSLALETKQIERLWEESFLTIIEENLINIIESKRANHFDVKYDQTYEYAFVEIGYFTFVVLLLDDGEVIELFENKSIDYIKKDLKI